MKQQNDVAQHMAIGPIQLFITYSTTKSSMVAHILNQILVQCGQILTNFATLTNLAIL